MKNPALTLALLLSLVAAASAQESRAVDVPGLAAIDRSPADLPLTLAESIAAPMERDDDDKPSPFSLGASGGYLRVKDADDGTWFGGVQARLRAGHFAAEASIQFHQDKYEDGDVVVTQYPVQLTAFLYIIPEGPIRPYILGGVGWYYTRIDYRDELNFIDDDTDRSFGWHFGAGAELFLSSHVSVNADVRYIFIDPDTDQVVDADFNYWQISFGLNFLF